MVSKEKREACKRNGFQVNHGNTHSKTVGNKTPRKSAQNEPVQQPNSQESPEISKTFLFFSLRINHFCPFSKTLGAKLIDQYAQRQHMHMN